MNCLESKTVRLLSYSPKSMRLTPTLFTKRFAVFVTGFQGISTQHTHSCKVQLSKKLRLDLERRGARPAVIRLVNDHDLVHKIALSYIWETLRVMSLSSGFNTRA